MFGLENKFNKHKKQEPKEETVTHTMVEHPNTPFMPETSKVVQLLLDQDRDIRKSLTPEEELQTVKKYLERPNRSDLYDVLELEKRLEFKKRFDRGFIPTIPVETIDVAKSNLKKEYQETTDIHEELVNSADDIQKQIDALEQQKNDYLTRAREAKRYIGMGDALYNYLEKPDDLLWSTPLYEVGIGQYHFGLNGLLHLINTHSQGKLPFITDYNEPYYKREYEVKPSKHYQVIGGGMN